MGFKKRELLFSRHDFEISLPSAYDFDLVKMVYDIAGFKKRVLGYSINEENLEIYQCWGIVDDIYEESDEEPSIEECFLESECFYQVRDNGIGSNKNELFTQYFTLDKNEAEKLVEVILNDYKKHLQYEIDSMSKELEQVEHRLKIN